MPDFCTCGAQLPPDARFCHKCAKPQYDYPNIEAVEEPVPAAVAPPVAKPIEISFRNSTAVRSGFMAAGVLCLIMLIPMRTIALSGQASTLLWVIACLFCGGILGVFFYARRAKDPVTVRGGARMGWITGMISFGIIFMLLAASLLSLWRETGGIAIQWREQMKMSGAPQANIEDAMRILESTPMLVTMIVFFIIFLFTLFTLLPTAGGAVGARLMRRDS